ncbi:MAG: hypothetical protein AAFV19_11330 [Pseudomonadota bacterium]
MRLFRLVLPLVLLAGCDEPTIISHVDKLAHMSKDDLWTMQDGRGIPVEIHGSPFNRITDREVAEVLRPPGGASQEVRFYATPVGSWTGGHPWRIVLHFNPQGAPNSFSDCQLTREARTNARPEDGFTVNVSFCKDDQWQAHGYLQVLKIEDGDTDALGNTLQQVMLAIFREEPDR